MTKTELARIDEQREAQATVERLTQLSRVLDIALPEHTEEKWHYAQALENEAAVLMAKRGFVYLVLRDEVGHGRFLKELEARGIEVRSAQNAMAVARMLAAMPPAKVKALSVLSGSKLIELAKVPRETLEEMEAQGTLDLDDVDTMSVRELKEHLRRERLAREKAELQRDNLRRLTAEASAAQRRGTEWHPLVARVRMDSTALAEQANLAIDEMESLLAELESPLAMRDLDTAAMGVASTTLYTNLRAVYAKASRLMRVVREVFPDAGVDDTGLTLFTDDEAARWQSVRAVMLAEHRAKAAMRHTDLQVGAPAPKKRGRPAGSGKKGATKG